MIIGNVASYVIFFDWMDQRPVTEVASNLSLLSILVLFESWHNSRNTIKKSCNSQPVDCRIGSNV